MPVPSECVDQLLKLCRSHCLALHAGELRFERSGIDNDIPARLKSGCKPQHRFGAATEAEVDLARGRRSCSRTGCPMACQH